MTMVLVTFDETKVMLTKGLASILKNLPRTAHKKPMPKHRFYMVSIQLAN